MVSCFVAVNDLSGPLRKQKFTLVGLCHICEFGMVDFDLYLFVFLEVPCMSLLL